MPLGIDRNDKSNYNVIMIVKLIKIGNSKGIRIPKTMIEQCGLKDQAELILDGKNLVIKPKRHPREGWAEELKNYDPSKDDAEIWPEFFDDWELEEWEWE